MIHEFYLRWIQLESLAPSVKTNDFFTKLIEYVKKDDYEDITITSEVLEINKICALAEYELEKFWNTKIVGSADARKELQNFIYYSKYTDLTRLEIINAKYFFGNIEHILFVWGGPLPLTSIILAQEYSIRSTIIDNSEEAVLLSKKLVAILWLEHMIRVELWDIKTYRSNIHFDLCYLASLVFIWDDHDVILQNTSILRVKNFLIRTSQNKRQLLYRKINEKILRKYLLPLLVLHPKNDIINSFILLTKYHHE